MSTSDPRLIEEAIAANAQGRASRRTLAKYETLLGHFAKYLASVRGCGLTTANRVDVAMFMTHLEERGGSRPSRLRRACEWCRLHGYPDGRSGSSGWSASTRKGYLAAIRFFYFHCMATNDLPDIDPSVLLVAPKVATVRGFTPTIEELKALWDAPGKPSDRLLVHWMYYAPSRLATFANARWRDIIDLDGDDARWQMVGKGGKVDEFPLHPILRVELRRYRRWQVEQAVTNPELRAALSMEESAYVLLSRRGRKLSNSAVAKLVGRRAVRAGVAVYPTARRHDAPGGVWTKMSPHAFRRAWAHHALNDPVNPQPLEVVSEGLGHADVRTTQRHYAFVKSARVRAAILGRSVG